MGQKKGAPLPAKTIRAALAKKLPLFRWETSGAFRNSFDFS